MLPLVTAFEGIFLESFTYVFVWILSHFLVTFADCLAPHIRCGSYCNEATGTSLRECTCGRSGLWLWGVLAGLWMPALRDYFFLDQYDSSMSLTLPPIVFFCNPVVNWCFGWDKGSGNRTPNVLWDVKVSRVGEDGCSGFMLSFYSRGNWGSQRRKNALRVMLQWTARPGFERRALCF